MKECPVKRLRKIADLIDQHLLYLVTHGRPVYDKAGKITGHAPLKNADWRAIMKRLRMCGVKVP